MLRLVVAGFATIQAVIISVFYQTHLVFALAKHAKALAVTLTPAFRLVALHANKWSGHTADSTANPAGKESLSLAALRDC